MNNKEEIPLLGTCPVETKMVQGPSLVWLSWLERPPVHLSVLGSEPTQGRGCGLDPLAGHVMDATDQCFSHQCFFFSLFTSIFLSL